MNFRFSTLFLLSLSVVLVNSAALKVFFFVVTNQFVTVAILLIFYLDSFVISELIFLQQGQICVSDRNCDAGLHCETCVANGNARPRCTRIQPINPLTKV